MLIFDKITATWQGITFGTKFVLIISSICLIADLNLLKEEDILFDLFKDVPQNIIHQYQFWRLFIP
jgi:membrane associated rhomboid family serine protease